MGVGTAPGLDDVIPFHNVGLQVQLEATGLSLVDGVDYFTTVRAWNQRGMSASASSDGVHVDRAPVSGLQVSAQAAFLAAEGTKDRTVCGCPAHHADFDRNSGACHCQNPRVPTVLRSSDGGSSVTCVCPEGESCFPPPALPYIPPASCSPPAGRRGPHEVVRHVVNTPCAHVVPPPNHDMTAFTAGRRLRGMRVRVWALHGLRAHAVCAVPSRHVQGYRRRLTGKLSAVLVWRCDHCGHPGELECHWRH